MKQIKIPDEDTIDKFNMPYLRVEAFEERFQDPKVLEVLDQVRAKQRDCLFKIA